MRFKQYLTEINTYIYDDYLNGELSSTIYLYLMEMKVVTIDNTIKVINDSLYQFNVNDILYDFTIKNLEVLPGYQIYTVYFHPSNTLSFDRLNKHTLVQVRKVFEKVITCMVMFIGKHNPKEFTFTGHDHKLYKTYKVIIEKIKYTKPFNSYDIETDGRGFTFKILREDNNEIQTIPNRKTKE